MRDDDEYVDHVLYLVTVEHVIHHAFMFWGVVAVVGGCEGPVRTGAEKKKAVKPAKLNGHDNSRDHSRVGN